MMQKSRVLRPLLYVAVLALAVTGTYFLTMRHAERLYAGGTGATTPSYGTLQAAMEEIHAYTSAHPGAEQDPYHITGYALDAANSRIVVYLNTVQTEAIAWFRAEVSDADFVVFVEKTGFDESL